MTKTMYYNNDELEVTVGDVTYSVKVHATGTWYYHKATRVEPEESELNIDEVESTWTDENGNVVKETEKMYDELEKRILDEDWEESDPPEPDYDYYEEREIARWEADCARMGY